MLCTEVSGNINDPSSVIALQRRLGAPFEVDYVDLEWDQVHARRLVVKSGAGRVVEIRLGERVEEIGLKDGDVLGCDVAPDTLAAHASSVEPCAATAPAPASGGKPVVVAVQLRSARVVRIRFTASQPVDPALVARVGWEVGNMHVPLFRGEVRADGPQQRCPAAPACKHSRYPDHCGAGVARPCRAPFRHRYLHGGTPFSLAQGGRAQEDLVQLGEEEVPRLLARRLGFNATQ